MTWTQPYRLIAHKQAGKSLFFFVAGPCWCFFFCPLTTDSVCSTLHVGLFSSDCFPTKQPLDWMVSQFKFTSFFFHSYVQLSNLAAIGFHQQADVETVTWTGKLFSGYTHLVFPGRFFFLFSACIHTPSQMCLYILHMCMQAGEWLVKEEETNTRFLTKQLMWAMIPTLAEVWLLLCCMCTWI